MTAHLRDQLMLDSIAVEFGIEERQAVGLVLHLIDRRRPREQHHPVGDMGVGDPDLLAIDAIAARLAHSAGLELGRVQPGIGLSDGKAHFFRARQDRRDHALLLFLGAEQVDGFEAEYRAMDGGGRRHAAARFGHRLHHDGRFGDAKARAAH